MSENEEENGLFQDCEGPAPHGIPGDVPGEWKCIKGEWVFIEDIGG